MVVYSNPWNKAVYLLYTELFIGRGERGELRVLGGGTQQPLEQQGCTL